MEGKSVLKKKYADIGGQGVLEGVMMRSPSHSALVVRKDDGSLAHKEWDNKPRKSFVFKIPVVRGVVNFVDMMKMGVGTMLDAVKLLDIEEEPTKFEKYMEKKTGKSSFDVMMGFGVAIGLIMAIGIFFILPTLLTSLIKGSIENALIINLIDGAVRMTIFVVYLALIRKSKDIRRVFGYHGAEHRTISTHEAGEELTVENVRKKKNLHPRCGTSFLLLVMVITILIYSLLGWSDNMFVRLGIRLAMLPFIAGISYELLKFLAHHDNFITKALRWPGMQLQRLTTADPDDGMIEVAISAFEMALREKTPEELAEMRESFNRAEKKAEDNTQASNEGSGEEANDKATDEETVAQEEAEFVATEEKKSTDGEFVAAKTQEATGTV